MTEREEVLNQYEYDAWGNVTESQERLENRFQFNGQSPVSGGHQMSFHSEDAVQMLMKYLKNNS